MEFKDRIKSRMAELGLRSKDLSDITGVSKATVSFWLNGTNRAKGANLLALARALRCSPDWLSDGKGEVGRSTERMEAPSNAEYLGPIELWDDDTPLNDDEAYVPFLKEVELSAGSGKTAVEESSSRKLRFGKLTLRRQGVQPSEAVCVTVSGNSMEPVLPDKSTVGVDRGATSVIDGKMYALNHAGQLRVKMLYRMPGGGIRLRSYNRDEHPDEEYSAQEMFDNDLIILGKVFWYSVLV